MSNDKTIGCDIDRIAILVVDYPKVTETFIMRDVMAFDQAGVQVSLHPLGPERDDILHPFAEPTRKMAKYTRFFGAEALSAFASALLTKPKHVFGIIADVVKAYWREPVWMAKTLILIPKATAIGRYLKKWGAEHVHGEFAGHPGAVAWMVGRLEGLPYSISCRAHDIFITQSLLEQKLGEAAFVRTISDFNSKFLLEKVAGLSKDKIHVLHSSVSLTEIPALSAPQSEPFLILYIGSLEVRKGIDVLLRALAKADKELGNWRCEIVGGGPEDDKLKRLSEELGLDRVSFRGPQAYSEVSASIKRASVCVAPSVYGPKGRTEGIPNVMIEALAHQRPAISTNVSGIPELIRPGESGWLTEPGDVDGLAQALLEVSADPQAAYKMAVRGREIVAEEFNIAENAMRQLVLFSAHKRSTQT